MSKILFCGDVHLSDRPPLGRVENYREQVLDKLEEIGKISNEEEVDAVCLLGDIYHSKRPMFTSHYLVQKVQEVLATYHGKVFILPGNHDQGPEGLDSLRRQPLGVLRETVTHILGWTSNTFTGGHIDPTSGSLSPIGVYTLISRPYDAKRDLDPAYYRLTDEEKLMPAPRILVAHGSLVPKDDPNWAVEYHHYALPVEDIDTEGIALLVSGHIHEPFGPMMLTGGTTFLNPGSISRTSRKEINFTRTPIVVLYNTALSTFTSIPLKSVLPASEVFVAPEEGGSVVTDEIREFADSLATGLSLEEVSVDQMLAGLSGVSEPAKEIIREELEEAGV